MHVPREMKGPFLYRRVASTWLLRNRETLNHFTDSIATFVKREAATAPAL